MYSLDPDLERHQKIKIKKRKKEKSPIAFLYQAMLKPSSFLTQNSINAPPFSAIQLPPQVLRGQSIRRYWSSTYTSSTSSSSQKLLRVVKWSSSLMGSLYACLEISKKKLVGYQIGKRMTGWSYLRGWMAGNVFFWRPVSSPSNEGWDLRICQTSSFWERE